MTRNPGDYWFKVVFSPGIGKRHLGGFDLLPPGVRRAVHQIRHAPGLLGPHPLTTPDPISEATVLLDGSLPPLHGLVWRSFAALCQDPLAVTATVLQNPALFNQPPSTPSSRVIPSQKHCGDWTLQVLTGFCQFVVGWVLWEQDAAGSNPVSPMPKKSVPS